MHHDVILQAIFYFFAAIAVASAVMVITQNNPVRCVLFLVLTFFSSAALWLLVEAEFLALILILVYVGAVMTLFLFVVMMLNIDIESIRGHLMRHLPMGLIMVALFTGLLMVAAPRNYFKDQNAAQDTIQTIATDQSLSTVPSNTEALGLVLYTDYLLAFELAAAILLVAIIAAITLVHRGAVRSKRQNIKQQIMTQSTDRVSLITMKSEK